MVYFSTDYFSTDYFSADYFAGAPSGEIVGQIGVTIDLIRPRALGNVGYWSTDYWSEDQWSNNYWADQYTEPYFRGTFQDATGFFGSISTTLSGVSGAFVGSAIQVENFDVSVAVGVAWTISAYEIYTGSSATTLDDLTSSVTGTFVAADGRLGSIAATLEDAAANFDGTNVTPANVIGTIGTSVTLAQTAIFSGTAIDPSAIEGVLAGSLDAFTSAIAGTYDSGTFTGTIPNNTLDDFTGLIQAGFFGSGVKFGPLAGQLEDFTMQATGTKTTPNLNIVHRRSRTTTRRARRNRTITRKAG